MAKEAISEEKIKTTEPVVYDRYREALRLSMKKLDEISSRYRDDAEASIIRKKLTEFLEEIDSSMLTPEMRSEGLEGIIEEAHHLVEWRRFSTASGRDISLRSWRRTREDAHKR